MALTELKVPVTATSKSHQDASGRAVTSFYDTLSNQGVALKRATLRELQINLGKVCNQACEHCHVEAGPKRTEIMTRDVVDQILTWIKANDITSVDLTGGAPELNPSFRYMVETLRALDINVISRCNLTILFEPGQEDLGEWYANRASSWSVHCPAIPKATLTLNAGKGVFDKSIRALQQLNSLGYGVNDTLQLDLVYNPGGPFLPPPQAALEADYRERLNDDFGIQFTNLFTLTNLPVHRFEHYLKRTDQYHDYMDLLTEHFNPATIDGLMCRHIISVDWLGRVYDCDFNQMLEIPMAATDARYLWDVSPATLDKGDVAVANHCYGCTAGAGSSCGGTLV